MTSTNEITRSLDSLPEEKQPTSPYYKWDDNNNVETYIRIPTGWKYAGTERREVHNSKVLLCLQANRKIWKHEAEIADKARVEVIEESSLVEIWVKGPKGNFELALTLTVQNFLLIDIDLLVNIAIGKEKPTLLGGIF